MSFQNLKLLLAENRLGDRRLGAVRDGCMASIARLAAQDQLKAVFAQRFRKPVDAEDPLVSYLGRLGRGVFADRGAVADPSVQV